MARILLISLVLSLSVIRVADSFCMMSRPTSDNPQNCVYKNHLLSLDSTFTDYDDCIQISCSSDGSLSVCGIGIHAGVYAPPPGCMVIKGEKCSVKLVNAQDPKVDCHPTIIG